jgi:hypothetical protein
MGGGAVCFPFNSYRPLWILLVGALVVAPYAQEEDDCIYDNAIE